MEKERGEIVDVEVVKKVLKDNLKRVFGLRLTEENDGD
jgi:hypothetical protein